MPKSSTPSKLFGLTQQEMAILLGISRGHYGMYESGLRPLPHDAALLLSEMLAHHHSSKGIAKADQHLLLQQKSILPELNRMLTDNEYKHRCLQKKIEAARKKHAAAQAQLPLAEFFASPENKSKLKISSASEMLVSRAERILKGEHLASIIKLELNLKLLELEKLLLQSKIQKIGKSLKKIGK